MTLRPKRRRRRQTAHAAAYSLDELAGMVGLHEEELRAILGRAAVSEDGVERFDWARIVASFGDRHLLRELAALRAARLRVRTSPMWLAGYPELVAQWHATKNGDLFPDQVSRGSSTRIWWTCPEGPDHEWSAIARSRTNGTGCPCCAGQRLSVTNTLAARQPAIAAEWHPTKNGAMTPHDVVWSSSTKVWWACPKAPDHEWRTTVNRRSSAASGCPFCAGLRLSVSNALDRAAPAIAREWHPTKNGTLLPSDVTAGASRRVWWLCPASPDHAWQTTVNARVSHRRGCPFCACRRVSRTNSLASLFPELAREWDETENGPLTPSTVAHQSHRRVVWRCPSDPAHRWRASVQNRTAKGSGCPHCSTARRAARR